MTISWLADKIEQWPTAKLVPYARNARTHSDAQVAQIAASIAEFGFTNPILAGSDGVIVAGHGRLAAAQKLGIAMVPVVVLDHLTPTQRRALVIADNRIAENAGWDDAMLQVDVGSAGVAMAAVGSAAVVAAGAATGWPQFPQKRSFSASVARQCGHCIAFVLRRSGAFQCLRPR